MFRHSSMPGISSCSTFRSLQRSVMVPEEPASLFSTASTLRMSSQSSTALGCPSPPGQEESSRWWLVMHRVPFTAGCPAHDSSTLSTVAVLISSENSMAVLEPVPLPPCRAALVSSPALPSPQWGN